MSKRNLKDKILHTYPTPIAQLCQEIFKKENENSGRDIIKTFDFLWTFLGISVLADYMRYNSPSKKQNIRLISSLRSMTVEKWMEEFRSLIPFLGEDPYIPDLISYFRTKIAPNEDILNSFNRFRKRINLDYIPTDSFEIRKNRNRLINMLKEMSFLSKYSVMITTEQGSFILRGISGMKKTESFPGVKPGEVGLLNPDKSSFLSLSPFIAISDDGSKIVFTNFFRDKAAYMNFVQNPAMVSDFYEYKNIMLGNPDFSKLESRFSEAPAFQGVKEKLAQALSARSKGRILIEGYPGSGKTMLAARIERFIDPSEFTIFKYYLEESHLLSSSAIFSRFFYTKLNSMLEKPHPINFKGQEWKDFQKAVINDFKKSGKKAVFVIDSIDIARNEFTNEQFGLYQFLQFDFPDNLYLLMTTRTGDYPVRFDARIKIPDIHLSETSGLFIDPPTEENELLKAFKYYEGSRGYIFHSIIDNSEGFGGIPVSIRQRFIDLLFIYKLFHPIREKICRYLSKASGACSLGEIAGDLEIYAPVVMKHIASIRPILKMEMGENEPLYRLFIPAFAVYVKKLEKPQKDKADQS